ncbi:MAG TPA: hypothetical protein VFH56_16155 [Acidimicrobiales bacterium]|nr:hypothetical protein [Acidimicrobiales bacterium]
MIDETAENWTFTEDDVQTAAEGAMAAPVPDEPWAGELEPGMLMGFLSEFRTAVREKAVAETGTPASARDRASSRLEAAKEPEPWEINPYEGSEAQVTPEWWFASDGRWYPPELHPDRQVPVEPAQENREAITETIAETTPAAESVGKDHTVRKPFVLRAGRKAGRFALEG